MEGKLNISEKVVDDLTIRQRRNHILGICPVCGCRDANFNKVKGVWRCWHCPSSGFIVDEEGKSVYTVSEVETPLFDIPEIRKLYSSLADKFHESLTSEALTYLKGRGLTEDTINNFKLGFCSTDFYDEYSSGVAEDSGIVYQSYPVLSNRIIIPYFFENEVTDLRGRILDCITYKKNTPTYLSLAGNHKSRGAEFLFNHDIIGKSDRVIITEGEFKALLAIQYGFPIVATPGVFAWNKEWSKLFKGKEVILAADNENKSGLRSPAYLMTKLLKKEIPQLKVAVLFKTFKQEKVDIDSLIINSGVKSFENAVDGAMDSTRWLWLQERKGYGG